MKLLIDENLARSLPKRLADKWPGSVHVEEVGLLGTDDLHIWRYARENDFTILTKDDDLMQLSLLHGHPPKVIKVCLGNCSTTQIESLVRWRHQSIVAFMEDSVASCLQLQ